MQPFVLGQTCRNQWMPWRRGILGFVYVRWILKCWSCYCTKKAECCKQELKIHLRVSGTWKASGWHWSFKDRILMRRRKMWPSILTSASQCFWRLAFCCHISDGLLSSQNRPRQGSLTTPQSPPWQTTLIVPAPGPISHLPSLRSQGLRRVVDWNQALPGQGAPFSPYPSRLPNLIIIALQKKSNPEPFFLTQLYGHHILHMCNPGHRTYYRVVYCSI